MEIMIEGIPHIPIMEAAEELQTTHLRILMLLKHGAATGCQVDGEWYIEKSSLACLKSHGMDRLEPASCAATCKASTCGCKGE
ncbi:MAG TPA: hypothetical protein VEM32_09765 [Geobacteraceae bacterium]|nr:hypothetical protein [Geobacteraceae bacterium]